MYLPKSKYTSNLHTTGGEYVYLVDRTPYIGLYFKTYNSRYFTGPIPSLDSKELLPIPDDVSNTVDSPSRQYIPVTDYDRIRNNTKEFNLKNTLPVPLYYPQPSEQDYAKGILDRYFARENSTGIIKEINQVTFNSLSSKENKYFYPNYTVIKLMWRITGPFSDRTINNYRVPGIKTLNLQTIQQTEKILPGISNYLKNPLEFAG
jgi:hypothetical protein